MLKNGKSLYYSLASLGGLLLLVISVVSLLQLGFSELLNNPKQPSYSQPPDLQSYVGEVKDSGDLTAAQLQSLEEWQKDYDEWRDEQKNFDWEESANKGQISFSLAMLLVGLPIFLVHLTALRRENNSIS